MFHRISERNDILGIAKYLSTTVLSKGVMGKLRVGVLAAEFQDTVFLRL